MAELRTILREEVYASRRRNGLAGPPPLQVVQIKYWLMLILTAILLIAGLLFGMPIEHSFNATVLLTQNPNQQRVAYTAHFQQPTPFLAKMKVGSLIDVVRHPNDKVSGRLTMRVMDINISSNSIKLCPLREKPAIGNNTPVAIGLALRSPSLWAAINGDSSATHPFE